MLFLFYSYYLDNSCLIIERNFCFILTFIIYRFHVNRRVDGSLGKAQTFLEFLKQNPSAKIGFREGIVEILFSKLLEDFVETHHSIFDINSRIDFFIHLLNSEVLIPIDNKFILSYYIFVLLLFLY